MLTDQMVVMDRSRALHVEFLSTGWELRIAGQHCSQRTDSQGRGWVLVCDCVPRLPLPPESGGAAAEAARRYQATLRWEGSTEPPEEVSLLELSRQGFCFPVEETFLLGRRLALQLRDENQQVQSLVAQLQWCLTLGDKSCYAGAEFVPGQNVAHLPGDETAETPENRPPAVPGHRLLHWGAVLGLGLLVLALWYLLSL